MSPGAVGVLLGMGLLYVLIESSDMSPSDPTGASTDESGHPVKRRLRRSIVLLFVVFLVVRILTTLPSFLYLTDAGVSEPMAKALSQAPTVLFLLGITWWFGWAEKIGLIPFDLGSRESLWAFLPVVVPIIAIPLLGLNIVGAGAVVWLLADAVFVSVWEEVYFRGILLEQVWEKLASPRMAVIAAAGLFSAIHLTNISALGADPTFVAVQLAFTFLGGIGLGAVRLRTGTLWPVMLAHFLVDGPERLIFGEQATVATPVILGLLLLTASAMAVYGVVATGRMDRNRPADSPATTSS